MVKRLFDLRRVWVCLFLIVSASHWPLATGHWSVWAAGEGISPEAQPFLTQLDSQDAFLRQEAFVRLEALRDPATASVVRPYLTSRNLETRAFAVRAVAAIEGVQAVPTLLARFAREHPTVRIAMLLALEPLQAQDPSIAPVLLAALRDRKPQVRMAAVDIVSRLEQPQAREAILTRWKRERHRDVRRVLELAMKRLGAL